MTDEADAETRKRTRLTIEVSGELEKNLQEYLEESGESQSEIVRKALRHFLKGRELEKQGYIYGAFKENENGVIRLVVMV